MRTHTSIPIHGEGTIIIPIRTRISWGRTTTIIRIEPEEPLKKVEKPWGHEMIWAHTERYVGKMLHVRKGESLSLQYHRVKDETIMLLSGRLLFEHYLEGAEPARVELGAREPFHIVPGTRHRMTALEDCEIVEVSTPELGDVVRLEDRYGREGTSAP